MSAEAWMADRLTPAGTLSPKHEGEILDLVWITAADAFITCSEDYTLRLWAEQPDGSFAQRALQQIDVIPCALTWDGSRQWVFVGLENGRLMIMSLTADFNQFLLVNSFALHEDRITAIRFDPVTDSVVTVSRDRGLCVYNIAKEQMRGGQVSSSWISAVELYHPHPDVPVALCATYESSILLVDCRKQNPKRVHTLNQHGGSVRCLHFDRSSKLLFSSGFDMNIILWRLVGTQVKLVQRLVGHRKKVNGVAYYSQRNRVISAGDDEAIYVWDPNTRKPTFQLPFAHEGAINHLRWVEQKGLLITCGDDMSIKLWRFEEDPTTTSLISQRSLTSNAALWKASSAAESPGGAASRPHPMLANFMRAMSSFVSALLEQLTLQPKLSLETVSWHVQELLSNIEDRVRMVPEATEEDVYQITEEAEGFVMTQLHARVFGCLADHRELDANLDARLNQLSFLDTTHLEIPADINLDCAAFTAATEALRQISTVQRPAQMIDCVVACCKHIHQVIHEAKESIQLKKHERNAQQANGEVDHEQVAIDAQLAAASAGADEFLPIFIYVVLIANPPKLHSCLQYVHRFRLLSKMGSEGGCFFTHLSSAVYFLEMLTASSLAIDPAVFDYYMNGCKVRGLKIGEPVIRADIFQEDADDQTDAGGLFGDVASLHDKSPSFRAANRAKKNGGGGGLFDAEEEQDRDSQALTLGRVGSKAAAKGSSAAVLSHLLHAMDEDLESDNLFTSVKSSQEPQSNHTRKSSDAESLLRELELEDNDDDLTALSNGPSSPIAQPAEAQVPEVKSQSGGIALGNAAVSLANCENQGFDSWGIPSDDDDLPVPVQWESPSASPQQNDDAINKTTPEQTAGELASPTSASSAPAEDCGGTRRSAITAMFEQKIAVAEAERRTATQRAREKIVPTNSSNSLPQQGDAPVAARDVFFNDDDEDAKDVFFNDLELNSKDAKDVFFADDEDVHESSDPVVDSMFPSQNSSNDIDWNPREADARDIFFNNDD